MKVGRTTYETQRRGENEKLHLRETTDKVKSREKKLWTKLRGNRIGEYQFTPLHERFGFY